MTTTLEKEPNLAQPWAPHRVKIYFAVTAITGVVFVGMTIGVGVGLIKPTFTADVIANLLFGVPVILLPFVLLWEGKGAPRTRLEKAAELVLVYLPYTAASQIGYELVFLLGHPFGLWTPTEDPGWKWLWWQYGLADSRYTNANNWIFGLEFVGVVVGVMLFAVWTRLIKPGLTVESRIRCLWLAFAGTAMLISSTGVYYMTEVRSGFEHIGQGAFGFWFKFIGENVPFMVLPFLVLYAIFLQVDYLTRRAGTLREA
ncbi:emopamil-binding protein [Mycobacterium sp. E740]|uniref:emopamil-binding protein n=1 Tax=Mycobacterium sp. E740 TaxID=1834149 RepID=UPI0008004FA6|nr:emopamil-binding protein [Mycobacterium sp. E740]OBI83146.1 emopamil-binding protein [Mycobacterium sp. E740]